MVSFMVYDGANDKAGISYTLETSDTDPDGVTDYKMIVAKYIPPRHALNNIQ